MLRGARLAVWRRPPATGRRVIFPAGFEHVSSAVPKTRPLTYPQTSLVWIPGSRSATRTREIFELSLGRNDLFSSLSLMTKSPRGKNERAQSRSRSEIEE